MDNKNSIPAEDERIQMSNMNPAPVSATDSGVGSGGTRKSLYNINLLTIMPS